MKLTAPELQKLGIVDLIIKEPLGGAQNDPQMVADQLRMEIGKYLVQLRKPPVAELVEERIRKFRAMGQWTDK